MVQKIPDLNPKNLFKIIFSLYMLVGMHYYSSNMGGYGLYLPFNVIGWILIASLIGLGFFNVYKSKILHYSKLQKLFLIGLFFFLPPMFYYNNELAHWAVNRIAFLFGGFLFLSSLIQHQFKDEERLKLVYIVLVGITIQSILGIIQYYGLGTENSFILSKKIMPYGSFQQRNVMASFMATGTGISLFLLCRDKAISGSKIRTWLILLIPFTTSILTMGLKSNTGALGIFLAVLFQIHKVRIRKRLFQYFFSYLIAGLLIGAVSPILMPKLELAASRSVENRIQSGQTRIALYDITFQMWKENPITGVGYGGFTKTFRNYVAYHIENIGEINPPGIVSHHWDHPHNEILLWMSEGGLAPLIGMVLFIIAYLIMISKWKWQDALPFIALILPILIHTQLEFPFRISLAHWVAFLTLIYVSDKEQTNQHKLSVPNAMIIPAISIPIIVYSYMGVTLRNNAIISRFENTGVKDYNLLLQVKDPGALRLKYDNYILKMMLDYGIEIKKEKSLQLFLDKAEEFVSFSPNLHVYQGMQIALNALGREEDEKALIGRASYLYPYLDEKSKWLYFAFKDMGNEDEAKAMLEKIRYIYPEIYEELYKYQKSPSNRSN